jgi:hypothetical protein
MSTATGAANLMEENYFHIITAKYILYYKII